MAEYNKNNRWRKVAVCMAAVVAVITVAALVLPAATMGRVAYCGKEEHRHTAECYERQIVCGKEDKKEEDKKEEDKKEENKKEKDTTDKVLACPLELHKHQQSCYGSDGTLVCGYADYVVHEHAENCYDKNGTLVCVLPEVRTHTHDASCYTEEKRLVCTVTETPGHTHTEECYTLTATGNILCGMPEDENHVHTDECYEKAETLSCGQEEIPAHTHTDECYETVRNYICGRQEVVLHKHDDVQCYSTDGNGGRYLSCGQMETGAHAHDENCFTEIQGEQDGHIHTEECYADVVVCGKEEHTHEESCFNEEGEESGKESSAGEEGEESGKESSADKEGEQSGKESSADGETERVLPGMMAVPKGQAPEAGTGHTEEKVTGETAAEAAALAEEAADLRDFLQAVEIKDKDGHPVEGTVYIGENYKIGLSFAEERGGRQFNTDVTEWTYQLPSGLKVTEVQGQKMEIKITENNVPTTYVLLYDISESGLITIHLTDELKEGVNHSPDVSFDVQLSAQVTGDSDGGNGEIIFTGFNDEFKFNTSMRPSLSVDKTAEAEEYRDENNNSTGGKLSYTIKGNVVNGPVKGLVFDDEGGYSQEYFGNEGEIQKNLTIDSVNITCSGGKEAHQKTLTDADYRMSWEGSRFTLNISEDIRLDDCDTIEVKYSIPYKAAQGVSYYRFDVDNTVTFGATAVQPDTGTAKGEPEPDETSNQIRVTGGSAGISGMVKSEDDKDYDTKGLLHYTIQVNAKAMNYKPFYMYDELTAQLDGETYRVDAVPVNMQVKIKTDGGETVLENLSETDPRWLYHFNDPEHYPLPEENDYAYFGKGVQGNWKKPGMYDLPFNPAGVGDWVKNTSLKLPEDALIEVSYDINVDEEIGIYKEDGETLVETVKLRDYLERNNGAAILRNYMQLNGGGQWSGSKVDYSRGKKLRKTAVENKDGTIDYSVTLLLDDAVREVLKNNIKDYSQWYRGMNIDFYDKFQEGWEYVEGSLAGSVNFGTWATTFYYLDNFDASEYADSSSMNMLINITGNKLSPVTADGSAIDASWNGFAERKAETGKINIWWNVCSAMLQNDNINRVTSVTFTYTLKPTEAVGKNLSDKDKVNVHNDAAIRTDGKDLYNASHDLTYTPKLLSKTAVQNSEGSNVIAFEVEINQAGVDLNKDGTTIEVTDTMGANLTLKPGSLSVVDASGNVLPTTDYSMTGTVTEDADGVKHEQFTLSGLPDNRYLRICYEALVTEQGDHIVVDNTASISGIAETKLDENTAFDISNSSISGQGSIEYFTIYKVDKDNMLKMLEGAGFKIYKAVRDENGAYKFGEKGSETAYTAEPVMDVVTDAEGKVLVKDVHHISTGNYYILEETKAPAGYIKPGKAILVYFSGAGTPDAQVDKNAEIIGYTYAFTIKNEAYNMELPKTGGTGTAPYTIAGAILIAAAVLLYVSKKQGKRTV